MNYKHVLAVLAGAYFLGAGLGDAYAVDNLIQKDEYSELRGEVAFEQIELDEKLKDVAVDVYYREEIRIPLTEIDAYKSNTKLPVGASDIGYINALIPDFVFIEIGGGSADFGLCTIYRPEADNVGAEEHKYFPNYWPHERSENIPFSDKYLKDIAGLFEVYPELNKTTEIRGIANFVFYIFYWDTMFSQAGYFFGDNPDGIYIVDDPANLFEIPAYIALERSEAYRDVRNASFFLNSFPKGEPPTDESGFFTYSVYTWDLITRRLILWYFLGNYSDRIVIKEIVMGTI